MRLLPALVLVSALVPALAQAQVTNGSFEAPALGSGATTTFVNGSTGITGWTVVGTNVQLVDASYLTPGYTLGASDGQQWVDLTGSNESFGKGLSTSFASLAGQAYVLSLDVGRLFSRGTAAVEVKLGSTSLGVFTGNASGSGNTMGWQSFSTSFVGTGATQTLSFIGVNSGPGSDSTLIGLDNVSVSAVPEPGSMALLLTGLGVMGWVARRRAA